TIAALDPLFTENEFQRFKASQNLCLQFPPAARETALAILAGAPTNWETLPDIISVSRLQQLVKTYPECASVWYYLAIELEREGNPREAAQARETYQQLASGFLG